MIFLEQLDAELTASFFKERLLSKLHVVGIPEMDISIRMASEKTSDRNKNVIGFYSQRSQFRSKPYMSLSLKNTYRSLISLGHLGEDAPYELVKREVVENMIDTICHEYGHVIEEYLHVNYQRETNRSDDVEVNQVFKDFKNNFVDNEDFAEQFGLWLARRDFMSDEKSLLKVMDYFTKSVFTEESLDWIKLPKEQRDILKVVMDDEKRMSKWSEINDEMMGQSLHLCQDLMKTFKNKYETHLIKLSAPNNCQEFSLEEIRFEQYSHNVIEVIQNEKSYYLDLFYEQTAGKIFSTIGELEKKWNTIERQVLKEIKVKKNGLK